MARINWLTPRIRHDATPRVTEASLSELPFNDKSDFENAQRGFIAQPETIKNANGNVVTPAACDVQTDAWRGPQGS